MASHQKTHWRRKFLWVGLGVVLAQAALAVSAQAQTIEWTRQFGTGGNDNIYAVARDASGNVYVAGWVAGTLPGQTSSGGQDALVRKYDPSGNELWTRQFGSSASDEAVGVSADSSGVYVMGIVGGALPGQTHAGSQDPFVRKYDANGNELWTRQFGTSAYDDASAGFADGTGVYVVGQTNGTLPGQISSGGPEDAYVRKYDANGNQLWTRQFGTGGVDFALGIFADSAGVYVGGQTYGALPGQTSSGSPDAFVRKYDASGNEVWTRQFGTSNPDSGVSVSADGSSVYVAGHTDGAFPGHFNSGGSDVFVRKYDPSGSVLWTRQFGTSANDADQRAVSADGSGVYVAGHTLGTLPGQTNSGSQDVFVRKYDPSGNELWTLQFGTSGNDTGYGVAATAAGAYAAGLVAGTLPGQTSAGGNDAYLVRIAVLQADAGPDQSVDEGVQVCLNGSASTGQGLSFSWQQIAGCSATLDDPTSATPCFIAPALPGGVSGSCTLTFQLTVTDAKGDADDDTVDITVKNVNHAPVADAGNDQTVNEGSAVGLSAENSFDPDADPIVSFQWVQTGGQTVTLTGDSTAQPSFAAPLLAGGYGASEILTFEVTVSDGVLANADEVQVTVEQVNHRPTADAGADQTKFEGSLVTLDGSGSSDPDLDPISYLWTQTCGPAVVVSNRLAAMPTFTAPNVSPGGGTAFCFGLAVNDGQLSSLPGEPGQVVVTVLDPNDPPECALAQPSQTILWPPNHKLVSVGILGVTDPDNNAVTIAVTGVTQDESVNGTGDGDTSPDAVLQGATVLVRSERVGGSNGRVYRLSFTADDGQGGVCSGSVNVGVPPNMKPGNGPIDDGQIYDSTQP